MGKFFKIASHGMGVGAMVKDINPSCPHHGAKGKVSKAYPHKVTFIVVNKGEKYSPGDKLTKTIDQMEKIAQADPNSIAQVAEQNNKPIPVPNPPAVNNAANKIQQPAQKPMAPPEGNSQGQKISPQQPKGKYMNKTASVEHRGHTFPGYNKPMKSWLPAKKKVVLAKKGDKLKVVHFGASGYGHNYSAAARKSYLARSAKIKGTADKFSANYWARKVLWAGKGGSTKSSPKGIKGKYAS